MLEFKNWDDTLKYVKKELKNMNKTYKLFYLKHKLTKNNPLFLTKCYRFELKKLDKLVKDKNDY